MDKLQWKTKYNVDSHPQAEQMKMLKGFESLFNNTGTSLLIIFERK
jgi:hypothetical protein